MMFRQNGGNGASLPAGGQFGLMSGQFRDQEALKMGYFEYFLNEPHRAGGGKEGLT